MKICVISKVISLARNYIWQVHAKIILFSFFFVQGLQWRKKSVWVMETNLFIVVFIKIASFCSLRFVRIYKALVAILAYRTWISACLHGVKEIVIFQSLLVFEVFWGKKWRNNVNNWQLWRTKIWCLDVNKLKFCTNYAFLEDLI